MHLWQVLQHAQYLPDMQTKLERGQMNITTTIELDDELIVDANELQQHLANVATQLVKQYRERSNADIKTFTVETSSGHRSKVEVNNET